MNAFDFVITIAIGSSLATVLLSSSVALINGILGFAALVGFQYAVSWTSVRSPQFRNVITSEPRLIVRGGCLLRRAMRAERVSDDEIFAVIRSHGVGSIGNVAAVVMETDGSFTVLRHSESADAHSSVLATRVRAD